MGSLDLIVWRRRKDQSYRVEDIDLSEVGGGGDGGQGWFARAALFRVGG